MLTRRETLGASLAGAAAPSVPQGERPPNIVVLVADDLSAPYLGCYGDKTLRTPNLDRLAAQGMRFNRGYVTSPQCSPSRSSLFTGRSPHATGCSRLHAPLRPELPTLLEPLRERGYFTGAYRKHHQGNDFARRLDFYGDVKQPFGTFFERAAGKPFFLWMGFTEPHRPYRPGLASPPHDPAAVRVPAFLPDTPAIRQDLALHYDAIHRLDTLCGEVLDLLERSGQAENTMVVFFGDNGMPYPRAKATLYEAGVNVPLMVRWPGKVRPGSVSGELVSTVDLTATWLDVAGAGKLPAMEGRSLAGLLTGGVHQSRTHVFAERNWHDTWDPMRAAIGQRYSLILNYRPEVSYRGTLDHISAAWSRGGGPAWDELAKAHRAGTLPPALRGLFTKPRPEVELYDLETDPKQFVNLAAQPDRQGVLAELRKALGQWMESTNDFLPPPTLRSPGAPGQNPSLGEILNGYVPG